jgi:predicted glycosyltransferase
MFAHYASDERLEVLERQAVIVGVESGHIVELYKFFGVLVMRVVSKFFTCIFVATEMFEVVIALKDWVILKHPMISLAYKRFENRRREPAVIIRTKCIANIMKQSANHVFLISAIT